MSCDIRFCDFSTEFGDLELGIEEPVNSNVSDKDFAVLVLQGPQLM